MQLSATLKRKHDGNPFIGGKSCQKEKKNSCSEDFPEVHILLSDVIYKNLEIFRKHGKIKYYQGKLKKERDMRKYSRLVIALSHEGDENSVFSAPVVEMKNGDSSV